MRISIVDPSAYTPPYDHSLCAALTRAGVEVELVTSRFLYGPVPEPEGYEVREDFYRCSSRLFRNRPQSMGRTALKLAEHPLGMSRLLRTLSSKQPDIVHFQWSPVQQVDPLFLRRIKAPIVITAHDVVPREPRPGQLWSLKRLYNSADALIVHTDHGRWRLQDDVGIADEKINVIPHGALDYLAAQSDEIPIDESFGDLEGRRVVLFFGLMRPYKGIGTLIDAFNFAPDDAVLLVVGMPRMPIEPLQKRVRDLGLSKSVRFLPRFVGDPEVPAYFKRADLVVLPYRQIDQSGVLFTALAFHKPMILTKVGGFKELVWETGAARLVRPDDPEELGLEIVKLLENEDERKRLSDAAAEAAAGPYSWDRIAAQTLELYKALLQ